MKVKDLKAGYTVRYPKWNNPKEKLAVIVIKDKGYYYSFTDGNYGQYDDDVEWVEGIEFSWMPPEFFV